jgi:hypothetical protein
MRREKDQEVGGEWFWMGARPGWANAEMGRLQAAVKRRRPEKSPAKAGSGSAETAATTEWGLAATRSRCREGAVSSGF